MIESKDGELYVKLIDFGFANFYSNETLLKDLLGTPVFMAPEIITGKAYDSKVDIWSCGIMLQMLLTGQVPYKANSPKEMFRLIPLYNPSKADFTKYNYLSDSGISFLLCCLKQNPQDRFSASQLLQHPWIADMAPDKEIPKEHVKDIMSNLHQFNTKFKLEQAVYTFLAMNTSTNEDEKYLRELFQKMDTSKDGKISKEEFIKGMKKASGSQMFSDIELEEMFKETDADHNGSIDYIEFLRAASNKKKMLSERNLRAAFNFFDKDHNGSITKDEIKQVFEKGKIVIEDSVLELILGEIDSNADMNV